MTGPRPAEVDARALTLNTEKDCKFVNVISKLLLFDLLCQLSALGFVFPHSSLWLKLTFALYVIFSPFFSTGSLNIRCILPSLVLFSMDAKGPGPGEY